MYLKQPATSREVFTHEEQAGTKNAHVHCSFKKQLTKQYIVWWLVVAQTIRNLPATQETRVRSLGQEDPLGEGNDNPLQYSCPENPTDRGALWATAHGVTKESDMAE